MNRREFLQRVGLAAGSALLAGGWRDNTELCLVRDPADGIASAAPAQWATKRMGEVFSGLGLTLRVCRSLEDVPPNGSCLIAAGSAARIAKEILSAQQVSIPDHPEALALINATVAGRKALLACGRDVRGLVYALTDIADMAANPIEPGSVLDQQRTVVERPANAVRGAMRLMVSDVEDKRWFNDRAFWQKYLSMLVTQRFNRFNLAMGIGYDFPHQIRDAWFYFAYPFLLSAPGYDVRVRGLSDAERNGNLETLRFISDEAAARGLHFQLGIWTHAYKWTDSPEVNYTIEGVTPQNHAPYCRDALLTLLRECPNISGVTFRIHGESGVAEGSYDFWKTVFDGVVRSGRRVGIDMHAKGMDQRMIEVALATGMPVTISPKFWAEHMGLPYHQAWIRPTELPPPNRDNEGFFSRSSGSRSFLRYGYGDLLREDRKYDVLYRIWPGTQRLLLWGDPAMAAAYGKAGQFCGGVGIELFEPLSFKGRKGSGLEGGRDAYADRSLKPAADWEKYEYTYRLWGRLLYNPDSPTQTWRRYLHGHFGSESESVEAVLASASRILPLVTTAHLPSAANNSYWPEIYTNMPIVSASRRHPYGDTPSPKRFGTVSPLDPQLFSTIDQFVEELLANKSSGKYSPAQVAEWLIQFSDDASHRLAGLAPSKKPVSPERRRLVADVAIQAGLGWFFAWKLRAGILHGLHVRTGDSAALREALSAYRTARQAWKDTATSAQEIYVADVTFGLEEQLRGHWVDRIAAIDGDIADMEAIVARQSATTRAAVEVSSLIAAVLAIPEHSRIAIEHIPPSSFEPGRDVKIEFRLGDSSAGQIPSSARFWYRHVNQAEAWRVAAMDSSGDRQVAVIPGWYSRSPFPLQYYFELRDTTGRAWLHPGLARGLTQQPYFVLRQT